MSNSPAPAPSDPSSSADSGNNNDWLNQITPSEKKSAAEVDAEDDSTTSSFSLFRIFGGAGALLCALIVSRLPKAINNYNKSQQEQREQEAARERQRVESLENWKQSRRSQPAANAGSAPSPTQPTPPPQPLMPTSSDPGINKILDELSKSQQRAKEDQESRDSLRSKIGQDRPKRQTAAERLKEMEEKRKANRPN